MGAKPHTPGPWFREADNEPGCEVVCASGYTIATVWGGFPDLPANARLIAAAPELLDVAGSAYVYGVEGEYEIYLVVMGVEIVRAALDSPVGLALQRFEAERSAAIAKATGEGEK